MDKKNNWTYWNPINIAKEIWPNKDLILQFIRREISGRYRESYVGVLWSFLTPILMLSVYTFVFSVVFKARWDVHNSSKTEFALLLFCGMIAFNIFAEVISRAPGLIIGNVNYVKKVIFPLEILPLVILGSALVHSLISILILIVSVFIFLGVINWTIVFIPFILLPLLLLSLGIGWLLSSLGVFLRDIGHVIGIFITGMMFLSPIFYPISSIPVQLRTFFYLNPLSYVVEDMRRVIVWGQLPNFNWVLFGTPISLFIAVLGYVWFKKIRGGFADVL